MKKHIVLIIFIVSASLSACMGAGRDYSKIEIYSAQSGAMLQRIDDPERIKDIDKNIAMGESELYSDAIPAGEVPEYRFVFYDGGEEESFALTTYADSEFLLSEFSGEGVAYQSPGVAYQSPGVAYQSPGVAEYLRRLAQ